MSETKRRPGGHPGMRGPGVPGEKAKDFRGSLGKLIRHCKPFYPVICIAILGDLAGVIIRLIGPNKISEITNLITAGLRGEIDMPAIQKICITLIILYVVGALLSFITGLVMTVVTQEKPQVQASRAMVNFRNMFMELRLWKRKLPFNEKGIRD